jgi:oligoendopeptidase F
MASLVRNRDEIENQYKWNAESVFKNVDDWQARFQRSTELLEAAKAYSGRLGEGAQVLFEALEAAEALSTLADRVSFYAGMSASVDTSDDIANGLREQAIGLSARVAASISFLQPEIVSLGQEVVQSWLEAESALKKYEHYLDDLFRRQRHLRSAEVEELLGLLQSPFRGTGMTYSMLTDADFVFSPAETEGEETVELTQGTLRGILAKSDRKARQTAWDQFHDKHLEYKSTLASNLLTSIKQSVLVMQARRYKSTLAASLFNDNIPEQVFHKLIEVFQAHLPIWHRYWALRRRILGVEELHPCDIWAPLTTSPVVVEYEQAARWVVDGMKPMGTEYTEALERGLFEDRWVDVYPTKGKRKGAFSWGVKGTYPFINMNFNNNILSLSTLAHETGHAMHSYLTWLRQPKVYSDYSLFVAEVASNFHQAMVRHLLFEEMSDPGFQISVIEEAMANFYRYFLVMPTLARFELETHERIERGQPLVAKDMIDICADLFAEAFGSEMVYDRQRIGIQWATFGHLYRDYYVFQYATGISAAHSLAQGITDGGGNEVEAMLDFLGAGSSIYPLEALARAGVDMTSPKPIEATFKVMESMLDRLDELTQEAQ